MSKINGEKLNRLILWVPQHEPTKEQLEELNADELFELKNLTPELFDELKNTPADEEKLRELVGQLIKEFKGFTHVVLPIGSPAFIMLLGHYLPNDYKNKILFAHSERQSVDTHMEDGSVKKSSIFRHVCFFNPFI